MMSKEPDPTMGSEVTSLGTTEDVPSAPKKRGRPPKAKTEALKKGNRVARGRPKGDASIINEYKSRMLASPKSAKVLEAIFNAALDNEHKNQAAAWKLVMDRVAPVGAFEKEVLKDGGRNAIQINITGLAGAEVTTPRGSTSEEDIIDGEYSES
jgi:hypothetical protein